MKRRVLSTVLAFVLVVSFMPLTLAFAEKEVTTGAEDATEITETEVLSTQEDVVEVPESGGTFEALGTTDEEELETDAAGSSEEEAALLAMDEQIGVAAMPELKGFFVSRHSETDLMVQVNSSVTGTVSMLVYEAGGDSEYYTAEITEGHNVLSFTLKGINLAAPETTKKVTLQLSDGENMGLITTTELVGWNPPTVIIENVNVTRISKSVISVELDSNIACGILGVHSATGGTFFISGAKAKTEGRSVIRFELDSANPIDFTLVARPTMGEIEEVVYPDTTVGEFTIPAWSEDMAKQITSVTLEGIADPIYPGWSASYIGGEAVPKTFDISKVKTTIVHTGASISPDPQGGEIDYTSPRTFVVTAADGSTATYTVGIAYYPTIEKVKLERTGLYELTVNFTSDSAGVLQMTYIGPGGRFMMAQNEMQPGENSVTLAWDSKDMPPLSYMPDWTDPDAEIPAYLYFLAYADEANPKPWDFGGVYQEGYEAIPVWKATALSSDATLRSLNLNVDNPGGTEIDYTPEFAPNTYSYSAVVDNSVDTISIYGISNSSFLTNSSGTTEVTGGGIKTLTVGENTFTINTKAEDGTQLAYTIVVTRKALSTTNSITSFKLAGETGLFLGSAIYVTVPAGTVLTNLEPVIAHNGVSITGSQDFSAPVTYAVTAEDGSSKTYRVYVSVAANPEDPEHVDKPAIDASDFGSSDATGTVSSVVTEDLVLDEEGNPTNFDGLYLVENGVLTLVDPSNYTLERGSTKITLLESYLKTLGSGSYTFAAIYINGLMATIDLQVALPAVDNPSAGSTGSAAGTGTGTGSALPATGDSPAALMAVIIVLLGGAALTAFALLRRRAVK